MKFAGKQTELENIMLKEMSHAQKAEGLMTSLLSGSQRGKRKGKVWGFYEIQREISRGEERDRDRGGEGE